MKFLGKFDRVNRIYVPLLILESLIAIAVLLLIIWVAQFIGIIKSLVLAIGVIVFTAIAIILTIANWVEATFEAEQRDPNN
jgi:hypothetical protein